MSMSILCGCTMNDGYSLEFVVEQKKLCDEVRGIATVTQSQTLGLYSFRCDIPTN